MQHLENNFVKRQRIHWHGLGNELQKLDLENVNYCKSCWWGALEQINFLVLSEHFLQVYCEIVI